MSLRIVPKAELDRIFSGVDDRVARVRLMADMCRLNTLVAVKRAGSGHLGSSFSAMDIVAWLYFQHMHVDPAHPDRDIFFSSKGHDVPGLYAVLYALGIISAEKLLSLRRLGGLDGHPDVRVAGCEANSGSLGMGLSKARGIAFGKLHWGRRGRVYLLLGDGELQEGQVWEAAQTCAHHEADITAIIDHNKIQTDMPVEEITSLGDLEAKFSAFGWSVGRCDGHHFERIDETLRQLEVMPGPRVMILDTVKGRGVSFMEELASQPSASGKYLWHSGAPDDPHFELAFAEMQSRIETQLAALGLGPLTFHSVPAEDRPKGLGPNDYVSEGFGRALLKVAPEFPGLLVLDGDLSADCRLREFEHTYPDRFIENGIAEQDMVSVAGGMALQGAIPVCNSFASFLCARANEQIYNNACEGRKVIYAAHFAGLIPAGPGKSHQSVRDIALMGSVPHLLIVQPSSSFEAELLTEWAVRQATGNVCIRMNIGPSPRRIALPQGYSPAVGRGWQVCEGDDAVLITYGAVMLHEALVAQELLRELSITIAVVNHPWLNAFDTQWLAELLGSHRKIFTLDDHLISGGMGDRLVCQLVREQLLAGRTVEQFGLLELPECGTPWEVLAYHGLDGASLAKRMARSLGLNADLLGVPEGLNAALAAAQ